MLSTERWIVDFGPVLHELQVFEGGDVPFAPSSTPLPETVEDKVALKETSCLVLIPLEVVDSVIVLNVIETNF